MVVLIDTELKTEVLETVLRMCQEDNGHLLAHSYTEVLAHRTKSITDSRCDNTIQLIHSTIQQHLQCQLSDGVVEGRAVLFCTADVLIVGTPHTHRY